MSGLGCGQTDSVGVKQSDKMEHVQLAEESSPDLRERKVSKLMLS